jgi:hypothetical protein
MRNVIAWLLFFVILELFVRGVSVGGKVYRIDLSGSDGEPVRVQWGTRASSEVPR